MPTQEKEYATVRKQEKPLRLKDQPVLLQRPELRE